MSNGCDATVYRSPTPPSRCNGATPQCLWLSLKCTPEEFAELSERPGIIPAPYMARAYWIALESDDALPMAESKRLLRQSYELVVARLP